MNFLAHAVVAGAQRSDHGFVFGAMLPDLSAMVGARRVSSRDDEVMRGITHHHQADAAFHEGPRFEAFQRAGRLRLRDAGVSRGAMLAAPHIGVELILDGVLAHDRDAVDSFRAALGRLEDARVEVGGADRAAALRELVRRLGRADLRDWYGSPAAVGDRLQQILGARPRLALRQGDLGPIRDWLAAAFGAIESAAPQMLQEVAGLLHSPR